MSSGERPIGAANGKQIDTEALCQPPPTPPSSTGLPPPPPTAPPPHTCPPPTDARMGLCPPPPPEHARPCVAQGAASPVHPPVRPGPQVLAEMAEQQRQLSHTLMALERQLKGAVQDEEGVRRSIAKEEEQAHRGLREAEARGAGAVREWLVRRQWEEQQEALHAARVMALEEDEVRGRAELDGAADQVSTPLPILRCSDAMPCPVCPGAWGVSAVEGLWGDGQGLFGTSFSFVKNLVLA